MKEQNAGVREPILRIKSRMTVSKKKKALIRLASIAAAILLGGLFVAAMGKNPLDAYKFILQGAFVGSERNPLSALQGTATFFVPLLIVSLGLACAFKMKFWNIGGEGQIIMGGIFASYFALYHSNLPHSLLMLVMFAAGAAGGALWGVIPAIFKVKFGTNETLFTLMLNYIAFYIIRYLEGGPWQGRAGFESIARFEKNAWLAQIGGVHAGWIFALLLMVAIFFYLNYTKQGYEISVVSESRATARYAGMSVGKIIIRTMLLSGAICGIAGMLQVAGTDYTLSTGITGNVGFTGITVAWLSGLNPFVIGVVSFVFAVLQKGSGVMQTNVGVSASASGVLQAIILFTVLGGEFFMRYSIVFRGRGAKK